MLYLWYRALYADTISGIAHGDEWLNSTGIFVCSQPWAKIHNVFGFLSFLLLVQMYEMRLPVLISRAAMLNCPSVCHRSTKSIIWRGLNERKTKSKFTNAGIKRIRLEKVCQLLSPHSSCWDHISWVGAGIEQQKESKSRSWNALFRSTRIACFADREGNIAVLDHMLDLAAHCFLSASYQF